MNFSDILGSSLTKPCPYAANREQSRIGTNKKIILKEKSYKLEMVYMPCSLKCLNLFDLKSFVKHLVFLDAVHFVLASDRRLYILDNPS